MSGTVAVTPATADRWADVEAVLGRTGCWCQYWRMSASRYGRGTRAQVQVRLCDRRTRLRAQTAATPAPGVLAYAEGGPVGWCGFGPRACMERLVRSRTMPTVDDVAAWSVVCFLVRPGLPRHGVAAALLDGVIDCARAQGAPALEAYPVDPGGRRIDTTFAYVGTTPMFERAGFRRVTETAARSAGLPRWLMRLDLL